MICIKIHLQIIMGMLGVIFMVGLAYILALLMGFHQVKEGYVGIYKRLGILQEGLTEPGFHFRIPFYQEFIEMKITIQTDVVENIPCGTSNGTLVYFKKVEVVNKLRKQFVYETVLNYTQDYQRFWVTDKLHHEINQFCSKHSLQQIYIDVFDQLDQALISSLNKDLAIWAPGIQILSIRVTKPSIPESIKSNFEQMEKIKVNYFIALEREKIKIEEESTIQKQKVIKEQSNLEVKKIDLVKLIERKQNDLKMASIQAEMIYEHAKTGIETQFLAAFEQAQLYPQLYTSKYLEYLAYDALTNKLDLTIGDKVPNINIGK